MKTILLFITTLFLSNLSAQTYQPVDNGSSVKFIIKNSGMDTEGKFSGLEGSIRFNPADLKNSQFSVSIAASSVNTDIDIRDNKLREVEYLDVQKYPRISVESKQITRNNETGNYLVKATVTIKGISKDISIPFAVSAKTDGMLLTGQFRISRQDFKIGLSSLVLSDNIVIMLAVVGKRV
jgi:polyisoprenoid-binding protein YceI